MHNQRSNPARKKITLNCLENSQTLFVRQTRYHSEKRRYSCWILNWFSNMLSFFFISCRSVFIIYLNCYWTTLFNVSNRKMNVMVIVLAYCVINRGFDPLSVQTIDNLIGIGCFPGEHTSLGNKTKGWLGVKLNGSECSDMSTHWPLFQSNNI